MRCFISALFVVLATFCRGQEVNLEALKDSFPNRGRLGVNHSGVSPWSSAVMFTNAMKQARPFYTMDGKPWTEVDANLYPTSVPAEGLQALILNGFYPSGEYVLSWDGDADLSLTADPRSGTAELVSQGPNRKVYRVDPHGYFQLVLRRMNPANPLRNLRLWLPGLENQGPWNPAYLAESAPFGVYRYMDMMDTNRSAIRTWSDRPTPDLLTFFQPNGYHGSPSEGVPAEWLVELSNVMDADPWFTLPHLADDDYVRRFAQLVLDELGPDRRVYVEYSNEVFNRAFSQRNYAFEKAQEMNLDEGDSIDSDSMVARFYGLRSSEVFSIWREVFGSESERVIGVATFGTRHPRDVQKSEELFSYRNHARNFDAMAFAPYTGVGIGRRFDKPFEQMSVEDLVRQLIREQATQIRTELERAKALSEKYNLPLLGYEGGQHLSLFGGGIPPEHNQRFRRMVVEANRHPLMEEFYRDHLRDWYTTTSGVYCHYVMLAPPTPGYYWGLKESIGQPLEEAPKARPFYELSRGPSFPQP